MDTGATAHGKRRTEDKHHTGRRKKLKEYDNRDSIQTEICNVDKGNSICVFTYVVSTAHVARVLEAVR